MFQISGRPLTTAARIQYQPLSVWDWCGPSGSYTGSTEGTWGQ